MTGRWSGRSSRCRTALLALVGLWPLVSDDGRAAAPDDPATRAGPSRVLLVLAAPDDVRLAEQARLLAADRAGAVERDLVLVEPAVADQADLRRRYGVAPGRFAALLIGKDGGVKLRGGAPMSTRTLFEAIDAMPMRQAEMRRRGSP